MGIVGKRNRHTDERGMETVAMIFVIPVLVVLVLALVDVGMMFRTRMLVENIARDAVRNAAADGGNYNERTNTVGRPWDEYALDRLWNGRRCTLSACNTGKEPTVDCTEMTDPDGSRLPPGNEARTAGDIITCTVYYPYKPINGALLNGPIGLGMGSLLKEFNFSVSARSETGVESEFGAYER